jgi:hypothetical protein
MPSPALGAPEASPLSALVIVGAPGTPEYATNFLQQATSWRKAVDLAAGRVSVIGLEEAPAGGVPDYEKVKAALATEPREGSGPCWIILLGHGTFDGKEARFNLRGPDLPASELKAWLAPFRRPLVIVNCTSASAPFINQLSATNRVIVSATKSGNEIYYTRFGGFLAEAIMDPAADLDKDGQVSLLEAFLLATRRTSEFYKTEGRIATEHALLDDNGDGLGTPGEWFRGLRAVKAPKDKATVDGLLARKVRLVPGAGEKDLPLEVKTRRDELENAVLALREQKAQMQEDEYYEELEKLLVQLATLYSPAQP